MFYLNDTGVRDGIHLKMFYMFTEYTYLHKNLYSLNNGRLNIKPV